MIENYKEYWKQIVKGAIEGCKEEQILTDADIDEIVNEFVNDDEIWDRIDACIWFYVNAKTYDKKTASDSNTNPDKLDKTTENLIEGIIEDVWINEADPDDDIDEITIYVTYITDYGVTTDEVFAYASKYNIEYEPRYRDPDDPNPHKYGSLIINTEVMHRITNNRI